MTTIRTTILLLCFAVTCTPALSQTIDFKPLVKDPTQEKALLDGITARNNKDIQALTGPNKKYVAEVYKERCDIIKSSFTNNEVITDPEAYKYLLALVNEIAKANPSINLAELRPVFTRTWEANAASTGEGTIFFNIGLFHRLDNEGQAIFALCHELSHYYLDHGNKRIAQYVGTVNSAEFQKAIKSIQKSEYGQNKQLYALSRDLGFNTQRHSREFERSADSMALEFMKNTGYDLNDALSCLALLDTSERDKYNYKLNLQKRFDFASFHFKNNWLESDVLRFVAQKTTEEEKAEADSLKSHPDCSFRIQLLTTAVKKYNKEGNRKFIVDQEKFLRLKHQFDYEILNYCFENNVSLCLYFSLEMLNAFPDNVYVHTMIGKCLNTIYTKQKLHELGRIVELPGPDHTEEYNNLLQVIQNLRLYEVASLSYYFLYQYKAADENNPAFAAEWKKSIENFNQ
jgi:Zn-dependent protease with chaperone function